MEPAFSHVEAFHVSCPETGRSICRCPSGPEPPMLSSALQFLHALYENSADPSTRSSLLAPGSSSLKDVHSLPAVIRKRGLQAPEDVLALPVAAAELEIPEADRQAKPYLSCFEQRPFHSRRLPLCGTCGGVENVIFCRDCGSAFHANSKCSGSSPEISALAAQQTGWQCHKCKVCSVCLYQIGCSPVAETLTKIPFVKCFNCDRAFHVVCALAADGVEADPKKKFKCKRCAPIHLNTETSIKMEQ